MTTVGDLKKLLADVPDDYVVRPQWRAGDEPGDHEPGVVLHSFDVDHAERELLGRISLFYLDEIEDEDEDDYEDAIQP